MEMRPYRLGKRQAAVEQTRDRIINAAKELVTAGTPPTVAAVARKAGVSRITVYNSFGSKGHLIERLRPSDPVLPAPGGSPRDQLRALFAESCSRWAVNPALFRHLPSVPAAGIEAARRLAEQLANADFLRPGCSIKEAEDVIGVLTSFQVFDRLHQDGRRSPAAVGEILMRLASGILVS